MPGGGGNGLSGSFSFSSPPLVGQQNPFSFGGQEGGGVGTVFSSSASSSSSSSGASFWTGAGAFGGSGGAAAAAAAGAGAGAGGEDRKRTNTDLDIDDILGQITEKMHVLSTGQSGDMHVEMLNVFMEVLDVENAVAQFYLESAGWDIQVAVSLCMESLHVSRPQHHGHRGHSQKRRPMDYKPREVVIEGLPAGWTARVSRHSGDIYFVHNATNRSQSCVPPGFADADPPPEQAGDMQQDDGLGAGNGHNGLGGLGDGDFAASAAAAAMHEAEAYGGGGGGAGFEGGFEDGGYVGEGGEGGRGGNFGLNSGAGFDPLGAGAGGGGDAADEVDMV